MEKQSGEKGTGNRSGTNQNRMNQDLEAVKLMELEVPCCNNAPAEYQFKFVKTAEGVSRGESMPASFIVRMGQYTFSCLREMP